jgi:hypothetical protein
MTASNIISRITISLLATLLLVMPASARNHTVFDVKSASTQLDGAVYFLNAVFEISLPPYILNAFDQGFDLPLAMEVEVFKHNTYWLDKKIASIKQKYKIQYHTLLDTVSVLNVNAGSVHYYSTLKEALNGLSVVLDYPLLDNNALQSGEQYSARLRIGIDETELPVPLKTSALWESNWNLMSDWYEWDVNP